VSWKDALNAEIDALTAELRGLGGRYERDILDLRLHAAKEVERLSQHVGTPGFAEAGRAVTINLGLRVGLRAVEAGDELDSIAREAWVRGLTSALRVFAVLIAGAA